MALLLLALQGSVRGWDVQFAVASYVVAPEGGCRVHMLLYDRAPDAELEARLHQWEGRDLDFAATGARAALVLRIRGGFAPETNWRGEYTPFEATLLLPDGTFVYANPKVKVRIKEPWRVQVEGALPEVELHLDAQVLTVR